MTLFKRTLHWTGALALAGVMSASIMAPSTAPTSWAYCATPI